MITSWKSIIAPTEGEVYFTASVSCCYSGNVHTDSGCGASNKHTKVLVLKQQMEEEMLRMGDGEEGEKEKGEEGRRERGRRERGRREREREG